MCFRKEQRTGVKQRVRLWRLETFTCPGWNPFLFIQGHRSDKVFVSHDFCFYSLLFARNHVTITCQASCSSECFVFRRKFLKGKGKLSIEVTLIKSEYHHSPCHVSREYYLIIRWKSFNYLFFYCLICAMFISSNSDLFWPIGKCTKRIHLAN